ncbi:GNAT family N-acetyltransferase [Bythopirellula polymerisocia]|uniref:N-acetyltransferase domain-containing protein n=1 Tax=Bythopirellula polymerisocia TaxID=2528003 RepID=A0A5C6CQB1_9BACT|nr:GNAT family N-acetyltransferase [Bythopirellula polymerisocia]TWU26125.1 hypothetical protein Pla144_33420 [Bythopirellula polymerisocia]
MQVETLDSRHLSAEDALAIGRLIVKVWPKPDKDEVFRQKQMLTMGQDYQGPDSQAPRSFVIREGEHMLAHAAVIPRIIGTMQGDIAIAGLCKVCSDPNMRGQGLGELVVRGVFDLVDNGVFEFSLFQTTPRVKEFYEGLGACVTENRFVNSLASNPRECPFWDEVHMRYPANRDWPSGEIDLRGPGY